MKKIKLWELLKDLRIRFIYDDLLSTGAQVTFYLLLSLPPFLMVLITLISYMPILNSPGNIAALVAFMPANVYEILQELIDQTIAKRSGTLLSFGLLLALWSSVNGVVALVRGINRAYDQEETRPFWRRKAVSLFFTLELALVLIFSFILIVWGQILGTQIFFYLGFPDLFLKLWSSYRVSIFLIAAILVFVSLYHNTPNRKLRVREVIPGALFATAGWFAISVAFSFYAGNLGSYSKVYGSLGSIIALLVWIYFNSITILLGAELNAALMFSKQGQIKPKNKRF